ncbi:hypothetical protein A2W24_03795 [Microgenomates group bacterium RBG_16_45_19]|nr:MAG: hypothetical protein A2W24_03795 [Microgenomates group bacterium RBG_16_45_19]
MAKVSRLIDRSTNLISLSGQTLLLNLERMAMPSEVHNLVAQPPQPLILPQLPYPRPVTRNVSQPPERMRLEKAKRTPRWSPTRANRMITIVQNLFGKG